MSRTDWSPGNAAEDELLACRHAGAEESYVDTLARCELVLPADGAGDGWPVGTVGDRTYVLAFTSVATMRHVLGADHDARYARFPELAREWPGPAVWLAVDPGLPVEAYLSPDAVDDCAALADEPATEQEHALVAAVTAADGPGTLRALLAGELCVPLDPAGGESRDVGDPAFGWWRLAAAGAPIAVFTSPARLGDQLGDAKYIEVGLPALAAAWPGEDTDLAVNPGTGFPVVLPGRAVVAIAADLAAEAERVETAAAEAFRRAAAEPGLSAAARAALADRLLSEALAAPESVQVAVGDAQVRRYLADGHGRVGGLLHATPPGPVPPAELPGADTDIRHVVRWTDRAPGELPRMDGREVPDGAVLVRLADDGTGTAVATYRSATRRWHRRQAQNPWYGIGWGLHESEDRR